MLTTQEIEERVTNELAEKALEMLNMGATIMSLEVATEELGEQEVREKNLIIEGAQRFVEQLFEREVNFDHETGFSFGETANANEAN